MELVEVTPDESIVPVFVEVLDKKEKSARKAELSKMADEEAARIAAQEAKEALKASAIKKLTSGKALTEEEAGVLVYGN
jgi:ribosome-binding factor A